MSETKEIPKGWEVCPIKGLGNIQTGTTPSKSNPAFYSKEFPFYKPTDLEAGINVSISTDGLSKLGINKARYVPENSTLVTCIGATIGKTGLIRKGGGFNQQINSITPYGFINPKYVYFQAVSHYFQSQIFKNASATTLPILNKGRFEILEMALAPLAEQHRIVAKIEELFSSLDKGIESLKTARTQLKVYRQAVLKWAFEGKLTNADVKEGELPEGWAKDIVKNIANSIQYGYTESSNKDKIGPKFLRITDIQENKVNWESVPYCLIIESEIDKYLLQDGDLVFARTGATVGKSFLIRGNIPKSVFASYLIRLRFPKEIYDKYVWYYFQSPTYWTQITDKQVGTGQPNVNGTTLGKLEIIIAPLSEQTLIVQEIESRLSVCDKMEESIGTSLLQAEALRQSILKKAFEGKLVAQDPTDEPASVLLERIKAEKAPAGRKVNNNKKTP